MMFFYEASLEVVVSVVIGFQYMHEYNNNPDDEVYTKDPLNATTRTTHWVLLYVFAVLYSISFIAVIIIMTRKSEVLEKLIPKAGGIY